MTTGTKQLLSSSTDGKAIKIAATASTGTAIHTAISSSGVYDEIYLYAYNSDSADRLLTIEFGDTTAPDHNIMQTIPYKSGLLLVVPGLILTNNAVVTAYGSTTNVITISGFVNRITNG